MSFGQLAFNERSQSDLFGVSEGSSSYLLKRGISKASELRVISLKFYTIDQLIMNLFV